MAWIHEQKQLLLKSSISTNHSSNWLHNSRLPISKLPAEVLSAIFTFAYGPYLAINHTRGRITQPVGTEPYYLDNTPYSAASVCSFWRNCIISIPFIWVVIKIPKRVLTPADLEVLERLVGRSHPLPFRLVIQIDAQSFPNIEKLEGKLRRHLDRCYSLCLEMGDEGPFKNALPLPLRLPNLRELDAVLYVDPSNDPPWVKEFAWGTPMLKSLVLSGNMSNVVDLPSSSIGNIEYLELGTHSHESQNILNMLPAFRRLRVLVMRTEGDYTPFNGIPLVLPSLECLYVSDAQHGFLSFLEAPRLKVLHTGSEMVDEDKLLEYIEDLESSQDTSAQWEELTVICHGEDPRRILGLQGLKDLTYQGDSDLAYHRLFEGLLSLGSSEVASAGTTVSLQHITISLLDLYIEWSIKPASKQPFINLLTQFFEKRKLQTHHSPLHMTLAVDMNHCLSIADICDTNNDMYLSLDVTPFDGSRLSMEEFAVTWRPSWW